MLRRIDRHRYSRGRGSSAVSRSREIQMPDELSRREIRRRRCSRLTALLHWNPSIADPRIDSRRTPEISLRIPPLLEESEPPMGSEQVDTASDRAFENFEVAAESGNKGKARGGAEISSVGEGIERRRPTERSGGGGRWPRRRMRGGILVGVRENFRARGEEEGEGRWKRKPLLVLSPSLLLKSNYNI